MQGVYVKTAAEEDDGGGDLEKAEDGGEEIKT